MAKIQQSFAFGALWHTGRVSCLCIRCVPTCLYYDKLEPLKALSILIHVTYTRKPLSLGDMERDDHSVVIMHTI